MDNIEEGDYVEVITDKGTFKGVLLPKPKFSKDEIVIIKLENGYNVGLIPKEVRLIKKKDKKIKAEKAVKLEYSPDIPTISIIGTGGTIASYIDYSTGAVHPALTAEDFLFTMPEISDEANIQSEILFNTLSENMKPEMWIKLARAVKKAAEKSDGIVIPHGTDTMSYTASALSFMFEKLSVPVVLVGSQRSSDRPSSDAYINLHSSVRVAKTDIGEVVVVMHAGSSDDKCYIHRGTRVRKMHTSRRDAFHSVNSKPLGEIALDGNIKFFKEYKKTDESTELRDKMDERVALLYYYPGMPIEIFEGVLEKMHGAIIMGTGLGHVSSEFVNSVKGMVKDGKIIGMTSQCIYGSVNMNVYSTGRELKYAGVIELGDMLPEVAYVKLMWLLGNYNFEEAKNMLKKNIRGEMEDRRFLL